MAYDVFISYSSRDCEVRERICSVMAEERIECWYDADFIEIGDVWQEKIEKNLSQSRSIVLIYTENSNRSSQVLSEIRLAGFFQIPIITVRLSKEGINPDIWKYVSKYRVVDGTENPLETTINALCAYIKKFTNPVGMFSRIGAIARFGFYPQENGTGIKDPIEWIVLDANKKQSLLISRYCLDNKVYHDKNVRVNWKDCSLRQWLNHEFLTSAFSRNEQSALLPVSFSGADDNQQIGDCEDRISLLSAHEVRLYYKNDEERICAPTDYAIKKETRTNEINVNEASNWWLRSQAGEYADRVLANGRILDVFVNAGNTCVRPVLCIDLNNVNEKVR